MRHLPAATLRRQYHYPTGILVEYVPQLRPRRSYLKRSIRIQSAVSTINNCTVFKIGSIPPFFFLGRVGLYTVSLVERLALVRWRVAQLQAYCDSIPVSP